LKISKVLLGVFDGGVLAWVLSECQVVTLAELLAIVAGAVD